MQALIHREIFVETLTECERLLSDAEAEARDIRRYAEIAARQRAEDVLKLAMTAVNEMTAAAGTERTEASRKRMQAESYRVGAERMYAALTQQLEELAIERAAVDQEREQLHVILATAEAHRVEALALQEKATSGASALLAAASQRSELLEATLADRIGEVASTLATLQGLVLERPTPNEQDPVMLPEFLSMTFREIREYRDAELTAADDRAEALIERAQQVAREIVAETNRDRDQLLSGPDARSVLDVVGVLLAESGPEVTPDPAIDFNGEARDRPIDVSEGPALRSRATAFNDADDAATALSEALGVVDDPSNITDTELADVLRTADRLLGDHATVDDAFDLALALSDALEPEGTEAADDSDRLPPPPDLSDVDESPTETEVSIDLTSDDPPETEVSIDLTSDDPMVSLDVAEQHPAARVGRVRSFWQSLF